ncbi:MAG TPA: hypothetical protein VMW10_07895 [Alphaproteobacteria bacterium]|nr:hypothetical protein [Alphaproteobacteria bacterium]
MIQFKNMSALAFASALFLSSNVFSSKPDEIISPLVEENQKTAPAKQQLSLFDRSNKKNEEEVKYKARMIQKKYKIKKKEN